MRRRSLIIEKIAYPKGHTSAKKLPRKITITYFNTITFFRSLTEKDLFLSPNKNRVSAIYNDTDYCLLFTDYCLPIIPIAFDGATF